MAAVGSFWSFLALSGRAREVLAKPPPSALTKRPAEIGHWEDVRSGGVVVFSMTHISREVCRGREVCTGRDQGHWQFRLS